MLTQSGVYYDTLVNSTGCDSVITLNLTIKKSTGSTIYKNAYGKYSFYGVELKTTGMYYHFLSNVLGCDSIITLDLTILKNPGYTYAKTVCDNYEFYGDMLTESGVYNKTLTAAGGYDSVITLNLSVVKVNTKVLRIGNKLVANTKDGAYQWINCSNKQEITGEIKQSFTPEKNGDYALVVSLNSCIDTSECFTVMTVGIDENNMANKFQVFPNPSNEKITIQPKEEFTNATVKFISMTGQTILEKNNVAGNTVSYDISSLARGIYIVEIDEAGSISRTKLLKN
ncbi:MAG: T9SS type A sorting domain-containing protein [Bacteroidetes bacterium]|nr:T9SS type A sorting domain-containing protein [Bacteroidota bacterium]